MKKIIYFCKKTLALAAFCSLSLWVNAQDDTYVAPSGTLYTHPGAQMAIFANLINDAQGGVNHSGGGTVYLYSRTGAKEVKDGPLASTPTNNYNAGGSYVRFYDFVTDNTASASASGTVINTASGNGAVNIRQEARITNAHTFANGMLWTPRDQWKHAFVHYESAGTYSGQSDVKHIDGYAAKSGSASFDYPIGDGTRLRVSGLVTPADGVYKSAYFQKNAQVGTTGISGNTASTGPLNGGITKVNMTEFWDIDGTAASNFKLTALNSVAGYSDWGTGDNFSGSDPSFITITGFDPWENLGIATSPSALTDDGAFVTTVPTTPDANYSAYTWASTAPELPAEMVSFTAQRQGENVLLKWTTASERGISHFDVEHSINGRTFTKVGNITGAHNATHEINYTFEHQTPAKGMNFYRLKMVEQAGGYEYSVIRSIKYLSKDNQLSAVWPNPTREDLNIRFSSVVNNATAFVQDLTGRVIQQKNFGGTDLLQLELTGETGIYFVKIVIEDADELNVKVVKL